MTHEQFHKKLQEVFKKECGITLPSMDKIQYRKLHYLYDSFSRVHYNRGLAVLRADVKKELIAESRTGSLYNDAVNTLIERIDADKISMMEVSSAFRRLKELYPGNIKPILIP